MYIIGAGEVSCIRKTVGGPTQPTKFTVQCTAHRIAVQRSVGQYNAVQCIIVM